MISLTRRSLLKTFSGTALLSGCGTFDVRELVTRRHKASEALTKIAMGSCLRENRKQPVWKAILIAKPDLFVHLDYNVYADTYSAAQIRSNYARLWSNAYNQALRRVVSAIAIWENHDYRWNNSGAECSMKSTSREIFYDFTVSRRARRVVCSPGVFTHLTSTVHMGSANRSSRSMADTNGHTPTYWGIASGAGWKWNC